MARARLLLFLLAALSTVATTVGAQTAPPGDDDGPAPALDGEDRAAMRQLHSISRQVTHQDERLAKVLTIVGPPDQPIPGEIKTELGDIRTRAQSLVSRVAPYLGGQVAPPAGGTVVPAAPGAAGPATAAPAVVREVRRLESIERRLFELDERLGRVLTIVGPPDQPVPDEVKAEMQSIKTAALSVVAHVSPYLGTVVPPPPTDGGGAAAPPGAGG